MTPEVHMEQKTEKTVDDIYREAWRTPDPRIEKAACWMLYQKDGKWHASVSGGTRRRRERAWADLGKLMMRRYGIVIDDDRDSRTTAKAR